MCIKDFNKLSLEDKVLLVNKSNSKLLESNLWVGKYNTNIYELNNMKVHVLINNDSNHVVFANAIEDNEQESFSDSIYMN